MHLAKTAAAEGAHGLLVVTPYYSRPPKPGLLAHFTAVADAPPVPICYTTSRHAPSIPIEWDTMRTLAAHPNIVCGQGREGRSSTAVWLIIAETGLAYYSGTMP